MPGEEVPRMCETAWRFSLLHNTYRPDMIVTARFRVKDAIANRAIVMTFADQMVQEKLLVGLELNVAFSAKGMI